MTTDQRSLRRKEKQAYNQMMIAREIYTHTQRISLDSEEVVQWALKQAVTAQEEWAAAYKAAYPNGRKETRWTRP